MIYFHELTAMPLSLFKDTGEGRSPTSKAGF